MIHLLISYELIVFLSAFFALLFDLTGIEIFQQLGLIQFAMLNDRYGYDDTAIYNTPLVNLLMGSYFFFFGLLLLRSENNELVRKAKITAVGYIGAGSSPIINYVMTSVFVTAGLYNTNFINLINLLVLLFAIPSLLIVLISPFFIRLNSNPLIRFKRLLFLYPLVSFILSLVLQSLLPLDPSQVISLILSACSVIFLVLLRDINQHDIVENTTDLAYPQASETIAVIKE